MDTGVYTPIGWRTSTPSYIEGHVLEYFTPYRLSELMSKVECNMDISVGPLDDGLVAYLFAALTNDAIARSRNRTFGVTPIQPRNGIPTIEREWLNGPVDTESLAQFAEKVLGKNKAPIRDQAVYTRSRSLVYAREDLVQELLQDFAEVLNAGPQKVAKTSYLVLVQMVMLLIHPFLDGNGRYTRSMLLSCGARHGCLATAALLAGIQWWNTVWFTSTITNARDRGLDFYVEAITSRVVGAATQMQASQLHLRLSNFLNILQATKSGAQSMRSLIDRMVATGEIQGGTMSEILGCSRRKADEVSASLLIVLGDSIHADEEKPLRILADSIGDAFLELKS